MCQITGTSSSSRDSPQEMSASLLWVLLSLWLSTTYLCCSRSRIRGQTPWCPDADGWPVPLETECWWDRWLRGIARNQRNNRISNILSPKVLIGLNCAGGCFSLPRCVTLASYHRQLLRSVFPQSALLSVSYHNDLKDYIPAWSIFIHSSFLMKFWQGCLSISWSKGMSKSTCQIPLVVGVVVMYRSK